MKKIFSRLLFFSLVFFILVVILLHFISQTPSAKVPGFTPYHILPERDFSYAVVFANGRLIEQFMENDTLNKELYNRISVALKRNFYVLKYSMIVKNALGKYVIYADYGDMGYMLITKPRFRVRLLWRFIGGKRSIFDGITVVDLGGVYAYLMEDYLVVSSDIGLIRSSIDLSMGKRRGSIFEKMGSVENNELIFIEKFSSDYYVFNPLVFALNKDKMFIKGFWQSSILKDAIRGGKMLDSFKLADVSFALKLPYLEPYDAYISHYPNDRLSLSSVLWDIGGAGFVLLNDDGKYLFSMDSRVPEERLMRDVFSYLREKYTVDSVSVDSGKHIYTFYSENGQIFELKYVQGIEKNRFVFANSMRLFGLYESSSYMKNDGQMVLDSLLLARLFRKQGKFMEELIATYCVLDSIIPSEWVLKYKEYKEQLLLNGRRIK